MNRFNTIMVAAVALSYIVGASSFGFFGRMLPPQPSSRSNKSTNPATVASSGAATSSTTSEVNVTPTVGVDADRRRFSSTAMAISTIQPESTEAKSTIAEPHENITTKTEPTHRIDQTIRPILQHHSIGLDSSYVMENHSAHQLNSTFAEILTTQANGKNISPIKFQEQDGTNGITYIVLTGIGVSLIFIIFVCKKKLTLPRNTCLETMFKRGALRSQPTRRRSPSPGLENVFLLGPMSSFQEEIDFPF